MTANKEEVNDSKQTLIQLLETLRTQSHFKGLVDSMHCVSEKGSSQKLSFQHTGFSEMQFCPV